MKSLKQSKRLKRIQLDAKKLLDSFYSGKYRSVFKGPGMEFDEVRRYVESDDSRFIEWNVTSRMGYPYTKTFREERELIMHFLIDVSASQFFGSGKISKFDMAMELAALFSFIAVSNNDKVGALLFSDKIERWVPPKKGKKHVLRLLNDLNTLEKCGKGSDLKLALRTAGQYLKRRGMCIILSDFKTPSCVQELSIIARKHDVIAVRIYDPLDKEFPQGIYIDIADSESGRFIPGAGISTSFRKQYREFSEVQRLIWLRECQIAKADILEISTLEDPVNKLLEFLKWRNKRS